MQTNMRERHGGPGTAAGITPNIKITRAAAEIAPILYPKSLEIRPKGEVFP